MRITAQPLTHRSFLPYGRIISGGIGLPIADTEEITYWGRVAQVNMSERLSTGIMLAHDRDHVITQMERHVNTSEILIAVEGDSVICFAAPSGTDGPIGDVTAFAVKKGDAIAMFEGTWHWAAFPCQTSSSKFIVIFANGTETADLETKETPESILVDF